MNMSIHYEEGLPEDLRNEAVVLFAQALKDKLEPILGNISSIRKILTQSLELKYCLAAVAEQRLVGVLGVRKKDGGFLKPSMCGLVQEYGPFGGLLRLAGLGLLRHRTEADEWYIGAVAVAEGMRGQGIGSKLIGLLESAARREGILSLTLQVTNSNHSARSLYDELGFVETRRHSLWPFNHFYDFPFDSALWMEKDLSR